MSAPSMTEHDPTRLDDEHMYLLNRVAVCQMAFNVAKFDGGKAEKMAARKLLRAKMALDKFKDP